MRAERPSKGLARLSSRSPESHKPGGEDPTITPPSQEAEGEAVCSGNNSRLFPMHAFVVRRNLALLFFKRRMQMKAGV